MKDKNISWEETGSVKCHGGWIRTIQHISERCNSKMSFSVFVPPQASTQKVPVLYWLSGLSCNEENFMIKAGAQKFASEQGLLLVAPDTSPRGLGIPGEEEHWDFGTGAGFYVNATEMPWKPYYQMYDYLLEELPNLIHQIFPTCSGRESLFGHSMGGHGALVLALRNPGRYRSISAFSPICAPMRSPWGKKAFGHYLGSDQRSWAQYDAYHLLSNMEKVPTILIDQGTEDSFLSTQLQTHLLQELCDMKGHDLRIRMQEGYDHSYFFVSTFMEDHMCFHAQALLCD